MNVFGNYPTRRYKKDVTNLLGLHIKTCGRVQKMLEEIGMVSILAEYFSYKISMLNVFVSF